MGLLLRRRRTELSPLVGDRCFRRWFRARGWLECQPGQGYAPRLIGVPTSPAFAEVLCFGHLLIAPIARAGTPTGPFRALSDVRRLSPLPPQQETVFRLVGAEEIIAKG